MFLILWWMSLPYDKEENGHIERAWLLCNGTTTITSSGITVKQRRNKDLEFEAVNAIVSIQNMTFARFLTLFILPYNSSHCLIITAIGALCL
jgi:hypothetical protein